LKNRTPLVGSRKVVWLLMPAFGVALLATAGFALQRELAPEPPKAVAPRTSVAPQKALTPEEEIFAAALWPIHGDVKTSAVGMSFAGISYMTGTRDGAALEGSVEPLRQSFMEAEARVKALDVPPPLLSVRDRYLDALGAYEQASAKMVLTARNGDVGQLLEAQRLSMGASEDLLRVSDVLWPGEYKPH
jgi:hypothetical protein